MNIEIAPNFYRKDWEALVRYCDDGHIEIDNNAAERSLRTVALGRENYLFAGSDAGDERATAIYSLIGSAKLNDLDLEAYLRTCCLASSITPSTASRNSCRGTSPRNSPWHQPAPLNKPCFLSTRLGSDAYKRIN